LADFRSRIGQSRVALVAPPDASPASYTNLRRSHSSLAMEDQRSGAYVTSKPSKRSMTYDDTAYHNQRATLDKQPSSHSVRSFAPSQTYSNYNYRSTTPPPIVIPGPSPPAAGVIIPAGQAGLGPQWAEMGNGQILTPMIGESKDIGSPVAGPVIVNLGSGWTTAASSQVYVASPIGMMSPPRLYPSPPEAQLPFLFYDPVRDSTAGPPPSPPRAIFDEPLPGTSSSTSAAAPTATRHLRHSSLRRSNEVKNEYLKPGNHIGSMKAGAESDYSINAISASSSDMGYVFPPLTEHFLTLLIYISTSTGTTRTRLLCLMVALCMSEKERSRETQCSWHNPRPFFHPLLLLPQLQTQLHMHLLPHQSWALQTRTSK
jgi:hypothetical protein